MPSNFLPQPRETWPLFADQGRHFYSHLLLHTLADGSTRDLSVLPGLTTSGGAEVEDGVPIWSPNGQWIAVPRRWLKAKRWWTLGFQLWFVRPDDSGSRLLTDEPDCHHSTSAWSPDGRTLAFVRMNLAQKYARPEISLIGVDGSNPRRLVDGGFQPAYHCRGTGGCLWRNSAACAAIVAL